MDTPSQITDYAVLPSPPFIEVAGISNFRDLGGYPISKRPSYSVRRDLIYRCAEPSKVTQDGISTMQKLGIARIYDLRSNVEIERAEAAGRGGVVEWDGCTRVFVPVFTDQDYSPEQLALRYKDYASGTEVKHNIYAIVSGPFEQPLTSARGSVEPTWLFSTTLRLLIERYFCILLMSLLSLWCFIVQPEKTELGLSAP